MAHKDLTYSFAPVRVRVYEDPPPAQPPVPGLAWRDIEGAWVEPDAAFRIRVKKWLARNE